MGHSHRLRYAEIRHATELVGQVRELGSSPETWRRHALQGAVTLLGGQVGLSVDMVNALPGGIPQPVLPIDIGWTDESVRRIYQEYYTSGQAAHDPGAAALMEGHAQHRFLTWFRRERVEDREWYASPTVSEARRSGDVDDFICSTRRTRPGVLQGMIVYRGVGARPFNPREQRLLRLYHAMLLRLFGETLRSTRDAVNGRKLTPRLREIFDLLLAGASVKDIATQLQISPHTVNDHMKELYKRLGVNSRVELQSLYRQLPRRVLNLPTELAQLWD